MTANRTIQDKRRSPYATLRRTIAHESGHVIVCQQLGVRFHGLAFERDPRYGWRGYVSLCPRYRLTAQRRPQFLSVYLAGAVAEHLILGNIASGVECDLIRAIRVGGDYLRSKRHLVLPFRMEPEPPNEPEMPFPISCSLRTKRLLAFMFQEVTDILTARMSSLEFLSGFFKYEVEQHADSVVTFPADVVLEAIQKGRESA